MLDMFHPSIDWLALKSQFEMVRENQPGHRQSILPKKERKCSKNNITLKHNTLLCTSLPPFRKMFSFYSTD